MDVRTLVTKLAFSVDEKAKGAFESVNHNLEGIKHRLEVVAGAEIIKGLFELAERFGGMGEQLESASVAAGLTVEQFQALTYAAAQNGVAQDEMSGGLARLSRSLYQAKKGSKEAVEAFGAAGITTEQIEGFHNSTDAFLALGDALQRIPDSAARVAILQELMGRGSFKLLKFATQGRNAINKLQKESYTIGANLSRQYVEDLAKSEQSMIGFQTVIKSVVAELGARFAPNVIAITKALERFWIRNRAIIMSKLDQWFYDLGFAIGATYAAFEILGNGIADFVKRHPELVDTLMSFIKFFGGVSLAVEGIAFAIAKTKTFFGALVGVIQVAMTPWRLFVVVAGAVKSALTAIALRAAILIEETFPALSEALLSFAAGLEATPAGVFALALLAIGAAAYTAWEMWNGLDFADTKLGKSLSWVADKCKEITRLVGKLIPDSFINMLAGKSSASSEAGDQGHIMFGGGAGTQSFFQPQITEKLSAVQAAASAPRFPLPFSPFAGTASPYADAQLGAGTTRMSSLMPVTVNVNGARNPKDIAKEIMQAIDKHQEDLNRRSMSHVQTALVH